MKERLWAAYISAAAILAVALVLANIKVTHLSSSVPLRPHRYPIQKIPLRPPHYHLQKLPVPPNVPFLAFFLNSEGHVLGYAMPNKGDILDRVSAANVALHDGQRLHPIPHTSRFYAIGFNDRGQVLLRPKDGGADAALWFRGKFIPIQGFLPIALNNQGEAVDQDSLWSRGKLSDISFGQSDISVHSINDVGQVVGVSYERLPPHASSREARGTIDQMMDSVKSRGTVYLLNPGCRQWERTNLLDNVPATLIPGASVNKLIINNRGQILLTLVLERFHSAVWDQGRVQEIDGPDLHVQAKWMNDETQVVGQAQWVRRNPHEWVPFIWQNGVIHDLNSLVADKSGIKLRDAMCINNKGCILCEGAIGNEPFTVILHPSGSSPAPGALVRLVARPPR